MLCKQGLGNFGAEVSKIYAQRVAACLLNVLKSLHHMNLALNDADRALIDVGSTILIRISLHQSLSPVDRQALGEAVTADGYNADFHLG